jgi:hypothetical protein
MTNEAADRMGLLHTESAFQIPRGIKIELLFRPVVTPRKQGG